MNYATALALPSWTAEVQGYSQQVIRYTPIVLKAFNKAFTPVIFDLLKGVGLHLIERERLWKEWALNVARITHNPLQSAVRAAHAELTSAEAQATYRHIRRITRETAMDALVIGLCGVIAVAQGVEAAQKVYGFAKQVYCWVDDRINPPLEQPTLLPTVDLCLAHLSDAELAARIESLVDPLLLEVVDDAIAPSSESIPLQSTEDDECPTEDEPVAFWNPTPTDMHTEVRQMLQATAAPAVAEAELVGALNVPGATGTPKRQHKAAGVKSKEAKVKAKV
jgi:hypothetical protein